MADREPWRRSRYLVRDTRILNELLEDLRKANLTASELKTFKREAQKAAEQVERPKQAAPEKTEKSNRAETARKAQGR